MLIVLGALRDTTIIGNELFLREISAAICLFLAILYLPTSLGRVPWPALALLLGYLVVVLVGAIDAKNATFVLLQGASLMAVILYALCWHSHASSDATENYRLMFSSAFWVLAAVCLGSLLTVFLAPGLAYEVLHGGEIRFHGLVTRPGWMAAMAGLLVGISLFYRRLPMSLRLIAGLIGFACLGLSGARTYWVAFAIAAIACIFLYQPMLWRRIRIPAAIGAVLVVGLVVLEGDRYFGFLDTAVRSDTVGHLSGRTSLWETALDSFGERPWFGYGITQGSRVLDGQVESSIVLSSQAVDPREISRRTLHNGYIQSLFDTGIVGTAFYLLIIVAAIGRILRKDTERRYATVFFGLIFTVIGNFSENVIYAASVMPSVFFWLIAVFALTARMTTSGPRNHQRSVGPR